MKHYFMKCIVVYCTVLMTMTTASTREIGGSFFEVLYDTSFIGGTAAGSSRDAMDCAFKCVNILGSELCRTVGFNKTTHSCRVSMSGYHVSALQGEVNIITLRKMDQAIDCGLPTSTYPDLAVLTAGPYSTLEGTSLTVSCNAAGYIPNSNTITCSSGGVWVPEVLCTLVDCETPVIPDSNFGAVNTTAGSNVSVTCQPDYAATNSHITCQTNGSWTESQCLKDCSSLTVPNAVTTYISGSTYLGSTATITCNTNFRLTDNSDHVTMNCTVSGWVNISGPSPNCWELMFRGTMGNGYNLSDIYLHGSSSSDASGMTTSDPVCQNVADDSCNLHYRNPNIDNWLSLNVQQVNYEFYVGTQTVMSMTMEAAGSTMSNWLTFGKTNAVSLPWTDMDLPNTWWAIVDWDTGIGRSFRVIENYGYCVGDILYTFVLYEPSRSPDAPPEDIMCVYETDHSTWPQFLYSLNGVKSNFHVDTYGGAYAMAIWVLHD